MTTFANDDAHNDYAHPEYLTDPAWVAAHLDDPNVVVLDCANTADAWQRGHIPGAAHVADNWAKDPDTALGAGARGQHVMTPEQFKAMAEGLGIGDATTVVAYDHAQSLTAARIWWVFNYYGHGNVMVLNGGWRAWVNAGQPIDFGRPKAPGAVTFTPQADESFIATGDELKEACSLEGRIGDNVVVWDVRSDAEWDGTAANYTNKRAGHIPGAAHLEWFHLMDRNTHEFKPATEIRRILTEHGITPDKTAYSY